MSWPGGHREYTLPSMLTHEVTMHYLALRKARLIGMLWAEGNGQYYLAPLDATHGYNAREPISNQALTALILSIELPPQRKPLQVVETFSREDYMRRVGHNDDAYTAALPSIAGPLFDRTPYEHSPIGEPVSKMEGTVADLIFRHQGRNNPVSIRQLCANTDLSERDVKGFVEDLRTNHRMPIGAKREEPYGYFWIVDAEDRELAAAPYRRQILTMWNTLRRMDSAENLRHLREKMTIEDPNGL